MIKWMAKCVATTLFFWLIISINIIFAWCRRFKLFLWLRSTAQCWFTRSYFTSCWWSNQFYESIFLFFWFCFELKFEKKKSQNHFCDILIPLMLKPLISYAEGPGPSVSNFVICLCFCPKLNDGADGFVETTTFLYPTSKLINFDYRFYFCFFEAKA